MGSVASVAAIAAAALLRPLSHTAAASAEPSAVRSSPGPLEELGSEASARSRASDRASSSDTGTTGRSSTVHDGVCFAVGGEAHGGSAHAIASSAFEPSGWDRMRSWLWWPSRADVGAAVEVPLPTDRLSCKAAAPRYRRIRLGGRFSLSWCWERPMSFGAFPRKLLGHGVVALAFPMEWET
jgi:hypothetical protein